MIVPPRLRMLLLTAHILASVGWLGAVAAFLALAVAGLTRGDAGVVRSSSVVTGVLGWWVILPPCLASLVTGIVQSLGTVWGLLQRYWVVMKLVINVVSTLILCRGSVIRAAPVPWSGSRASRGRQAGAGAAAASG